VVAQGYRAPRAAISTASKLPIARSLSPKHPFSALPQPTSLQPWLRLPIIPRVTLARLATPRVLKDPQIPVPFTVSAPIADALRVQLPWHPCMAATSLGVTTMTGMLLVLPIWPTPLVTILFFKPMPQHRALGLPLVPAKQSQETPRWHFSRTPQAINIPMISASSAGRHSLARIMDALMLQA